MFCLQRLQRSFETVAVNLPTVLAASLRLHSTLRVGSKLRLYLTLRCVDNTEVHNVLLQFRPIVHANVEEQKKKNTLDPPTHLRGAVVPLAPSLPFMCAYG